MKHLIRALLLFGLFSLEVGLLQEVQAAFPTISDVTYSEEDGANVTTHDVLLPPVIAADDLLVVVGSIDSSHTATVTWDDSTAGVWTQEYEVEDAGAAVFGLVYVKKADGTEDGKTLGIGTDGLDMSAWWAFRIPAAGWFGTLATGVYSATNSQAGTGTDPDPPDLAPGVGVEDFTWIALSHTDANVTVTGWSEADNRNDSTNANAAGANVAFSTVEANASSRNPAAYTISGAEQRIGGTLAIRPAAAGTTLQRRRRLQ